MSGVTIFPPVETTEATLPDIELLGFLQATDGVYNESPTLDTDSVVYTVPNGEYAIVESITIYLTEPTYTVDYDDKIWLLWHDSSESQDIWLLFEYAVGHKNTFQLNLTFKMDEGDKLVAGNIEDSAEVNAITETPFNIWVAGRKYDGDS